MRKLNGNDLFVAAREILSSGLKEKLQAKITELSKSGEKLDLDAVGVSTVLDVVTLFVTNDCRDSLYRILSGPFETDPENVGLMDIEAILDGLEASAPSCGYRDFFGKLARFLGLKQLT